MHLLPKTLLLCAALLGALILDLVFFRVRAGRRWRRKRAAEGLPWPAPAADVRAWRREIDRRFRLRWATVMIVLLGILTVAGWFGGFEYHAEIASQFRIQYCWAAGGLAAILACFRIWRPAAAAAGVALVNGALLLPWFLGASATPVAAAGARPLTLLFSNVLSNNVEHGRLLDLAARESPEIILLQEFVPHWQAAVAPLREAYPHHFEYIEPEGLGMALYSRLPIAPRLDFYGPDGLSILTARIGGEGEAQFQLVSAHPAAPFFAVDFNRRREELRALGEALAERGDDRLPLLFAGDLNLTMWSPLYRDVAGPAGLINARRGFGLEPSWPTFMTLLGVPLDHALCDPRIRVEEFDVLGSIGSDHAPFILRFAWVDGE